ncbi:MAG: hypothetical protein WCR27_07240 [Eubacteriales bacterium]
MEKVQSHTGYSNTPKNAKKIQRTKKKRMSRQKPNAIHINVYYKYLENKRYDYCKEKVCIQPIIIAKYHREEDVLGYHRMYNYLENEEGIVRSVLTIHHYMK